MKRNTSLQLQGVFCGEVSDLAMWDHNAFDPLYITIGLQIGETGIEGSDDFYVTICNIDGLQTSTNTSAVTPLRHHILVNEFHYGEIVSYINSVISKCPAGNWERSANWLSRFFSWEYEDYHE